MEPLDVVHGVGESVAAFLREAHFHPDLFYWIALQFKGQLSSAIVPQFFAGPWRSEIGGRVTMVMKSVLRVL